MAMEKTLCIIKPDAIRHNFIGRINARIERQGLRIIASKMLVMSKEEAKDFYATHREKRFYEGLASFMSSGPVLVQVLCGEGAIGAYRSLIGNTDPLLAEPGTLRAEFSGAHHGGLAHENALHGSDRPETAAREINFFFKHNELYPR